MQAFDNGQEVYFLSRGYVILMVKFDHRHVCNEIIADP